MADEPTEKLLQTMKVIRVEMKCTMVENGKKDRQNIYLIIYFPTSEGVSKVSERASERVSAAEGASEASSPEQANEFAVRANGRASGPVFTSLSLFVPDHNACVRHCFP